MNVNLAPSIKINLKWIINLNIKHKTLKCRRNLWKLGLIEELLNTVPKAWTIQEKYQ